jgi:hypothetical protein
MNLEDLQTGDIVLVSNYEPGLFNYFLSMIRYATHSEYVHIGMVVKDPNYLEKPLKGTFLWESGYEGTPDPQDGKVKLGVQLTDFKDIKKNYTNANFYVRRLKDNSIFTREKLRDIHKIVYEVPYDIHPLDWILAFFHEDNCKKKIDRFWCSAFVGYIFSDLGILSEKVDWSILAPADFGLDGENLIYSDEKKNRLLDWEVKLNL